MRPSTIRSRRPRPWAAEPLPWTLVLLLLLLAGCTGLSRPVTPPPVDALAGLPDETDEVPADVQLAEFEETNAHPYVLLGTLVLPDRVVAQGGLRVEDGRIQEVWEGPPPASAAGLETIDTGGIILPGLIDLHNHVAYNFLPFWKSGLTFQDRYQWQANSKYKKAVSEPYNAAKKAGLFDEMDKFGEIRGLVGGTTSILGIAPSAGAGILARNIDQGTLGGDFVRTNVGSVLGFGCSRGKERCPEQAQAVADLKKSFADGKVKAMVMHVGEGVDASSEAEFHWLAENDLLRPELVVTHGTAFTAADFQAMGDKGMGLVWSPRSNVELYGSATDARAARAAGVAVALAPDWSPSGSDNLLAEIRYVAKHQAALGTSFTDRELIDMATLVPAKLAGRADVLGQLAEGFVADILVLAPRPGVADPLASAVGSDERQVDLVTVSGVPLFGRKAWLDKLDDKAPHETIPVRGVDKAIRATVPAAAHVPHGDESYDRIHSPLAAAYQPFGALPELTANDP